MKLLQTWRLRPPAIRSAPRVDVALLVPMFVLLASVMSMPPIHQGYSVDLARVTHPNIAFGEVRDDVLTVMITSHGEIFFRADKIYGDELVEKLRAARQESGPWLPLYIKADRRAHYKQIAAVIDAAQAAQIARVTFIVEQRKPLAPTSPESRW